MNSILFHRTLVTIVNSTSLHILYIIWQHNNQTVIQRLSIGSHGISEIWRGTTIWGNHIYEILRFALDDNGGGWFWYKHQDSSHAADKSCHCGLFFSIISIFFFRDQPLIFFSHSNTAWISFVSLYQTSLETLYFLVNPFKLLFLCWIIRPVRSLVIPVYNTLVLLAVM